MKNLIWKIIKRIISFKCDNGETFNYLFNENSDKEESEDLPFIDENGNIIYYDPKDPEKKPYRDGDLPAIIRSDGTKEYYKNGKLHRDNDKPAVIRSDGNKYYYKNGKRHRDNDLPAVIRSDGTKYYYKNGKKHRDNDLPAIEWADGTKEYWKNGKKHRDNDLPAIEWADGTKEYYKEGKLHRDNDLPAIEWADGDKEYYKNGKLHTGMTVEQLIKRLETCSPKAVVCFRSDYGDYCHTQQCIPVNKIEDKTSNDLKETPYSNSGIACNMHYRDWIDNNEDNDLLKEDEIFMDNEPHDVIILS